MKLFYLVERPSAKGYSQELLDEKVWPLRSRPCLLLLLLFLFLSNGCRHQNIPVLPRAALDSFSPRVRDVINLAYQKAARNPRDSEGVGLYCMVLHAHQQLEAAAQCYHAASAATNRPFEWRYLQGIVYSSLGQSEQAVKAFEQATNLEPSHVQARFHYGVTLLEQGRVSEGRALFEQLVRDHSTSALALFGLGRAHEASSSITQAIEAFESACRLNPRYSAAHFAAAQLYARTGDRESARKHISLYEQNRNTLSPEYDAIVARMESLNATPQPHITRSVQLEAVGNLREAAAANRRALEIDPNAVQAHVNLISVSARLGRFDDAAEHYRRAVAIQPGHGDAHYNYGVLLYSRNLHKEAREAFQRALQSNPSHADALCNLGFLVEEEGNRKEALSYYLNALKVAPAHQLAHYHAGRLLVESGKPVQGIEHLRQTLEPEDERTPGFLYALATAYVRAGDSGSAVPHLQRGLQLARTLGQHDLTVRMERDLQALTLRKQR